MTSTSISLTTLFYAYILGGFTFIPLLLAGFVFYTIYTSVPAVTPKRGHKPGSDEKRPLDASISDTFVSLETNDAPRARKGWLIVRHTFEEQPNDSGYVNFMRTFLDARTKDPKRSRPKDMWYVVLKGKVLYLYEDEGMTECEAAIELSGYDVIVYPEGLLDGELFARRNSICIRPKPSSSGNSIPGVPRDVKHEKEDPAEQGGPTPRKRARERSLERDDVAAPWFMFIRSNTDMEDWYLALVHASECPAQTPTLEPLKAIFEPADMEYLVATLDEQPDVIPMRWFNALIGRIFFSYYRTHILESFIIGKLMKKLSKVKRPVFLSDIVVTEVSVGDKAPTFSKPMLKELTKEGDASMEVHARYKGEVRITVEATATINLGARLKTYTVKLVLAAILREIEGNMLIKVKRPPSNRIWYAFTQMPRIILDVEPVVSDRQITWSMILSTIESRLKEIIQESVVLPNMDDISFFESSSYIRRGGIWADACRQTRTAVTTIQPTISSAPEETQDTIPSLPQNIGADATEGRGTTEPLDQSVAASTDAQTFQEHAANGPSNGVAQPSRRRSWFSSPAIDELSLPVGQSLDGSSSQAMNGDMRGRAPDHNKVTSTSARSSRSRDGITDMVSNDPAPDAEDTAQFRPFLTPPERSLSRQSLRDVYLGNDSANSTKSALERPVPAPPRRTSDAASITGTPSSPPSAGSLLSTFRTRDRQALKDSAKEVVRKLGVNWGFRKDWNAPATSRESIDSSDIHAKDSTSGTTRASYADVRAAVAERKERGKITSSNMAEVIAGGTSGNEVPDVSDAPINKDKDIQGSSSLSVLPSSPENRQRRSPSRGPTTEIDDPPVEDHHTPIFVQPQGKTMTIPGIHASHRGEVMALGYVVPSDKSKNNPTVNSIYRRLMKSPVSTDPESSLGSLDTHSGASDTNDDVAQLTRPAVPPPLPPRSNLVSIPNILTSSTDAEASAPKDDDLQPWTQPESGGHEDRSEARIVPTPPPLPPRRIQTST